MTEPKYLVYGLSPAMQSCIKNAKTDFGKRSVRDVLDSVSSQPAFSEEEVNLMIFELGREYERIKNAGR
jgi:hypothetical protein